MSPRTPRLTAAELIRVLKKVGFGESRQRGSHIVLVHAEKKIRVVVPFHKGKDLPIGTLRAILDDAEISPELLQDLLQ